MITNNYTNPYIPPGVCKEEDQGQKTSIGALRVGDARHAAGAPFDAGLLRLVFQPQSLGDFTDAYSNPYKPLPFYLEESIVFCETIQSLSKSNQILVLANL